MSIKYLLPCSCGNNIPIETTQAGQSVVCSCGRTIDIPSMQGVRRLPQVRDSLEQRGSASAYGGVAVGLAILALVILGIGGTLMYRARAPIFIPMEYQSPFDTWLMWQDLKEGVRVPEYAESDYQRARRAYRQYMAISWVVIIVGGLLLASAGLVALRGRSLNHRGASHGAP